MDTAQTFIFLLRCWSAWSLPREPSVTFSMVFSRGTQLLVYVSEAATDYDEDDHYLHQKETRGSGPSVQILSSAPLPQDPGSPNLLVCLLTGLDSPMQDVMWWVDDSVMTSSDNEVTWTRSEMGGVYSATSVWEISAADWRSRSMYWCGTIQEGRVYRQKVCSGD